jgi:inosine triphosphate pyrophosphatase
MNESSKAKNYRKWFMESVGHEGLNNLLAAYTDKSADAVCTFAYSEGPGFQPIIFQGRTSVRYLKSASGQTNTKLIYIQGTIVPSRGPTHFGRLLPESRGIY